MFTVGFGVAMVCVRRRLIIERYCGFIPGVALADEGASAQVLRYIEVRGPFVIVMGPFCGAFARWSRFARFAFGTVRSTTQQVGVAFALFCGRGCIVNTFAGMLLLTVFGG